MSQNTTPTLDPGKIDSNSLDGWNKNILLILAAAGTAAGAALTDPVHQQAVAQLTALAVTFAPAVIFGGGALVKGIIDMIKAHATGKAAVAQAAATATVPQVINVSSPVPVLAPAADPRPSGAQIVNGAFNTSPVRQSNPDKPNTAMNMVTAAQAMATTDAGVGQILLDNLGVEMQAAYKAYMDQSLQPADAIDKIVQQYIGVCLTPVECAAVAQNLPLATILHLNGDVTIAGGLVLSHQNGLLGPASWSGLQTRAMYYAIKGVVDNLNTRLQSNDITVVRSAMADLGLNEDTQRSAETDGASWRVWLHGGFVVLNPAVELGLNPISYLPIK